MADPDRGWRWDPSLYAGSAAYYGRGRVAYPATLVDTLVRELGLDGTGRLLDVGCGPGSLTLPLAPYVAQAVGVDPDPGMLAEADAQTRRTSSRNLTWVRARAEELPGDLGRFRVVTLAQSFHWMDRERVARVLHDLLLDGGSLAFVHATTHEGVPGAGPDPDAPPRPPRSQIEDLVRDYLGPGRRAGAGYRASEVVTEGERGRIEAAVFSAAGLSGPTRHVVPGWDVVRSAEEIVASVFSLSYAAPHLFGGRRSDFERDLRALLERRSPIGEFGESMREIAVDVWRR